MGSLHASVVSRLQTRPSFFVCRLLFVLASIYLIILAARFYLDVQDVLSVCKFGKDWRCELKDDVTVDGEEVTTGKTHTETSISAKPSTPSQKPSWISGLSSSLGGLSGSNSNTLREWNFARDANDTAMSGQQCQQSFPDLGYEIARAEVQYDRKHISEKDIKKIDVTNGRLRARIQDGKLFVLKANLTSELRPKALVVLQSLDSAIANQQVPDIDFVFSVQRQVPEIRSPVWTFDRQEDEEKVWLMPSPELVLEGSNHSTSVSSLGGDRKTPFKVPNEDLSAFGIPRTQLVAQAEEIERGTNLTDKVRRLVGVWTTDGTSGSVRQRALVFMSKGQFWADGGGIEGVEDGLQGIGSTKKENGRISSNPDANSQLKSKGSILSSIFSSGSGSSSASSAGIGSPDPPAMIKNATVPISPAEMCRFSFLAHDTSFNIRVADGPLLCRSVLLTTKPKWIELYHGLMLANDDHFHLGDTEHPVIKGWREKGAGKQNVVLLADDFGDLSFKMEGLLKYPEVAEKIAANFVDTFRHRYLTNAATACYWRELIRGYSKVSYKPEVDKALAGKRDVGTGDIVERRSRSSMGVPWETFRSLDLDSQEDFDVTELR